MELQQDLTEEEDLKVKECCEKVDTYLEAFKRKRDLKTLTKTDDWVIFKDITDLSLGNVKTVVTRNLTSRGEIFEVFTLAWKSTVKGNTSSVIDTTKLSGLLECIVKITVLSDEMCHVFGERDLVRMVMEDLKIGKLDDDLTRTALTIVYNCCWRVPGSRIICREYIDVLQDLALSATPDIQADAFLALSYIVDKLEAHRLALNEPCVKFLMVHMKSSMSKSKKKPPSRYHYSALEITKGINQLAVNESNKLLIAELGGLDLLMRILAEGGSSDEERLLAARGIWQLAFKEENKAKIRRIKTFLTTLKRIKKTTSNLGLREACSGALFLVNDVVECDDDEESKGNPKSPKAIGSDRQSSDREHIMVSYQWDIQKRMLKVKKYLEKHGYNVWMDVDQMQGNILDTMAEAVQNASVVLVCATQKYSESQNCRTEAQYAYKQKKDIVPLMLEEGFEPKGWLGALMGMDKYFPLYSDSLMKKTLPELVKELGDRGKHEEVDIPSLDDVTGAAPSPEDGQMAAHDNKRDSGDSSGGAKEDEQTDKKSKEDSRVQKMFTVIKSKVPLLDRP
ncbi:uncharacterized protein LOC105447546 [Strongylocentrotus purpuratus]|uniref:TIR domain-containing protein n=1 Tax=Strongylocentrotus purpuratus TaxID=7668 RepID=A0A7M7SZZ2_STRPU|nr:uncharacterized protein LOC105447546 [Strongylocentrotus purpuratus]